MAISKSEFFEALRSVLLEHDATAVALQVQDPRMVQPLGAMAQMLAMLSVQMDINANEVFEKVKDATIYADAALKGIMPYARPARVSIKANNPTPNTLTIAAGRVFIDQAGRKYHSISPMLIPAATNGIEGVAMLRLSQSETQTHSTTVTDTRPFLTMLVHQPNNSDEHLSSMAVTINNLPFTYTKDFTNILPNDKVYHVEIDEYRQLSIKFGQSDKVGYQPSIGDVVIITTQVTFGQIDGKQGDEFILDTVVPNSDEAELTFALEAIEDIGADPIDLATLRELCKYPALYSDNAVYLGSFDALIRRHYPDLRFLSVWNEQIEENMRGASIHNINRLFVAFAPKHDSEYTAMQDNIRRLIEKADDGYRTVFYSPIIDKPQITITAKISVAHDTEVVKQQITQVLLETYGQDTAVSKRGLLDIKHKDINKLLTDKILALKDYRSDVIVQVNRNTTLKPEYWQYVDQSSMSIEVNAVLVADDAWGA
jgi:hypothetical protein